MAAFSLTGNEEVLCAPSIASTHSDSRIGFSCQPGEVNRKKSGWAYTPVSTQIDASQFHIVLSWES